MASFSDALQAPAQGRLKAEVLLARMERTLALRRSARTPTLAAFLEELQASGRMALTAWFAIGTVATLLLLAAVVIVLRHAPAYVAARPAFHGAPG